MLTHTQTYFPGFKDVSNNPLPCSLPPFYDFSHCPKPQRPFSEKEKEKIKNVDYCPKIQPSCCKWSSAYIYGIKTYSNFKKKKSYSGLIPWRAQLFQLLAYCWQHDPPIQQCSCQTFYLEEEKNQSMFSFNLFYQMNSSTQNVTCQ